LKQLTILDGIIDALQNLATVIVQYANVIYQCINIALSFCTFLTMYATSIFLLPYLVPVRVLLSINSASHDNRVTMGRKSSNGEKE